MGQRTWSPKGQGLEQAYIYSDPLQGWQVANEIEKAQLSINFNNSSIDCKNCNRIWKFATGTRK